MSVLLASTVQAACHKQEGKLVCSQTEVKNIKMQGYVSLMDVSVVGEAKVEGMLQAKTTHFKGEVKVKGSAHLNGSRVDGKTIIVGALKAEESHLKDIEITSNQVIFNCSKLNTLTVKPTKNEVQRVYLQGITVIKGDVVFESGDGEVIKSPQSRIAGKIIGGHLSK